MTLPAALLGLLLSSLLAVLYHIVRGDRIGRLFMYLGLSWLGFVLGNLIGLWRDWTWLPLGPLNLGLGTLGSLLLLALGDAVSRILGNRQSGV
jgi:hypothetical protein